MVFIVVALGMHQYSLSSCTYSRHTDHYCALLSATERRSDSNGEMRKSLRTPNFKYIFILCCI